MVVNEHALPIRTTNTLAVHLEWHLDSVVHAKPVWTFCNGETNLDVSTDWWPNSQNGDNAKKRKRKSSIWINRHFRPQLLGWDLCILRHRTLSSVYTLPLHLDYVTAYFQWWSVTQLKRFSHIVPDKGDTCCTRRWQVDAHTLYSR